MISDEFDILSHYGIVFSRMWKEKPFLAISFYSIPLQFFTFVKILKVAWMEWM